MYKKILFSTGTRADYGKIKPLINAVDGSKKFKSSIVVTGMHLSKTHGYTYNQIRSDFPKKKIFKFYNLSKTMDLSLAKSIKGYNKIITQFKPDMILVHGDRVEALAGSIAGYLNGILVGHVEGGEISGTFDDSMRHATSKMSNIHFVSNKEAKKILLQLGEFKENIHVIGSPEIDAMINKKLPSIFLVKKRYQIKYDKYAIVCFHPDLNENIKNLKIYVDEIYRAIKRSKNNYIIIYPNNDKNYKTILSKFKKLKSQKNIKLIPSMRFEYYLTLLKYSSCIIGNSSSGVREAPVFEVPVINIGDRQDRRTSNPNIINLGLEQIPFMFDSLVKKKKFQNKKFKFLFGKGNSEKNFIKIISKKNFWKNSKRKFFSIID